MKATIIATIALGAVATGFVAAAPVPSQSDFALESFAARNFADDDMSLLARAVDMDGQLEPRLLHALGHLFHRHSSNAGQRRSLDGEEDIELTERDIDELEPRLLRAIGHLFHRHSAGQRRDLSEVESNDEFLAARGILDDNDLKALQSRLIKLVKKLVKKLRTKVHNKVQAAKDDVQAVKDNAKNAADAAADKVAARSFDDEDEDFEMFARSMGEDDEDLERRLAFGLAFKAAKFAGKRIAHAVANRHRNHRRSFDDDEDFDLMTRSMGEDDEDLERRLAFGLAFKAAKFAGKRIAHAVANRHRNHRRSLDGEDVEDFEERSLDDEDNEEFEARDFDALLEGRDDFNML